MNKSIFRKTALIILPIMIIVDLIVLLSVYNITYKNSYDNCAEILERAQRRALERFVFCDLETEGVAETEASICSSAFSNLCRDLDLMYIYAIRVDPDANTETYLAIGFGPDANEEAVRTRYYGVRVDGKVNDEMRAVLSGEKKVAFRHETNQFGDTLICYTLAPEHYDTVAGKTVPYEKKNVLIGAEISISQMMDSFHRNFIPVSAVTVAFSVVLVLAFALTLHYRIAKPAKRLSRRMSGFITDREKGFEKIAVKGEDEFAEMARSFNHMAREIDTYIKDIDELTREKHKQEAELDIARKIQTGLLHPGEFHGRFVDINACMHPAKNVGGDLYDYYELDDGKVCIAIADVSGKGVTASLFMARAITLLSQYAESGYSPALALKKYNETLASQNPNRFFITTFLAVYDPATGELTYANAGHNYPYVISDALITLDGASGVAAGLFRKAEYQETTLKLKPGDTVFLFTDGVNEAVAKDGGFFGDERLEDALRDHCGKAGSDVLGDVLSRVERFTTGAEQSDDITILTMRIKDNSSGEE